MESQKIKEDRKRKFLIKMEKEKMKANKKKEEKEPIQNNNETNQQNQTNVPTQNNNINNQLNQPPSFNNETNMNKNNLNTINNILPEQKLQKNFFTNIFKQNNNNIDFKNIIEQTEKYDYMINFQEIIKRFLIIILTILHCLKYSPLYNAFVFKYTFVILELSSFFFYKYYYSKKTELRKKMIDSNNIDNMQENQIIKIINSILNNLGFVGRYFIYLKVATDIFFDISILFIINIIYFIINSKD